jgi:hypothetical protein
MGEEKILKTNKPTMDKKTGMSNAERDEFIRRIKGMSMEEKALALEYIPVELCLDRISKELERAKTMEERIKSAMAGADI